MLHQCCTHSTVPEALRGFPIFASPHLPRSQPQEPRRLRPTSSGKKKAHYMKPVIQHCKIQDLPLWLRSHAPALNTKTIHRNSTTEVVFSGSVLWFWCEGCVNLARLEPRELLLAIWGQKPPGQATPMRTQMPTLLCQPSAVSTPVAHQTACQGKLGTQVRLSAITWRGKRLCSSSCRRGRLDRSSRSRVAAAE